jgi:hypothetical protein
MQFPGPVCSVQGELFIDGWFCAPSAFSCNFIFGGFVGVLAGGEPCSRNLVRGRTTAVVRSPLDFKFKLKCGT